MEVRLVGRYLIFDRIASGGMADVHFGRQHGATLSRIVAVKQLHPQLSRDPEFLGMFLDEARITSHIHHRNVITPIDVVAPEEAGEALLVMEYVHGATLSRLLKSATTASVRVSPDMAAAVLIGVLQGLHAAHDVKDEVGTALNVVHRDISPQNIMVGVDGVPRVIDFGIAKAVSSAQSTRKGQLKGKLGYMSPEQTRTGRVDRRADIFSAGVVLWESLTGKRLFAGDDPAETIARVVGAPIAAPSTLNPAVTPELDRVVLKALERDVAHRFWTAEEFAAALQQVSDPVSPRRLGAWVARLAAEPLAQRAAVLARLDGTRPDAVAVSIDDARDPKPSADGTVTVSHRRPQAPLRRPNEPSTPPASGRVGRPVSGAFSVPASGPISAPVSAAVGGAVVGTETRTTNGTVGGAVVGALSGVVGGAMSGAVSGRVSAPVSDAVSAPVSVTSFSRGELVRPRREIRPPLRRALLIGAAALGAAVVAVVAFRRSDGGTNATSHARADVAAERSTGTAGSPRVLGPTIDRLPPRAGLASRVATPSSPPKLPGASGARAVPGASAPPSGLPLPLGPLKQAQLAPKAGADHHRAAPPERKSRRKTVARAGGQIKSDRCTPPYVVDAAGIRRVKPECL